MWIWTSGTCELTLSIVLSYRSMPQLIAMQFIVQSFAANVNYTNRNAKSQITNW